MKHPHEIYRDVLDAYRGLPAKLERMTPHSAELWRSYGREPKSRNPDAAGNVSAVTHFIEFCELNEAAEPGAGLMISNRVHQELNERFAGQPDSIAQADLECGVIDEVSDVQKWLARFDIPTATASQLAAFESECAEAIDRLQQAFSEARAERRRKQMARVV